MSRFGNATFELIQDEVNQLASNVIAQMQPATADNRYNIARLIDPRAIYEFWFSKAGIAVNRRYIDQLDYYGKFEFIDHVYRVELGQYVIFSGEDSRVKALLDVLLVESKELG